MNYDLPFCTKLKGWAVSERRISRAWLAGSFSCCSFLLTQAGIFDPRRFLGRETSSYLKGTGDAMMASAEYQL